MKYSLHLGRVAGISISVHWTFLILIIWIIIANARSGLSVSDTLWSVGFVLAIFVCVILHELGHALAARRYKIQTKDITILPIGGIAQLESIPEKPKEELVVAIAGPLVNVAIALILYPIARVPDVAELQAVQKIGSQNFLAGLMSINLWLALFNLIPAFPMDGGRILRALLGLKLDHAKATRIAASIGQLLAIGFVFLGFMSNPFLIFIGLFIFLGAQAEAMQSQHKLLLKGFTVNDVTMHEIPMIEDEAPVRDATAMLLNSQNRNFLVMRSGIPVGVLTRDHIVKAIAERGEFVTVEQVKDPDLVYLSPTTPLEQAWNTMQQKNKGLVLVSHDGKLTGVVDHENVKEFILIRTAANQTRIQGGS